MKNTTAINRVQIAICNGACMEVALLDVVRDGASLAEIEPAIVEWVAARPRASQVVHSNVVFGTK